MFMDYNFLHLFCPVPKEFILYTSVQDGSIMILSKEPGVKPSPVLLAQGDQPSAIDYDPTDNVSTVLCSIQ